MRDRKLHFVVLGLAASWLSAYWTPPLIVLAVGYITLVLSGGIAHHPIRAKHGRRR